MLPNKFDYADQQRIAELEAENAALKQRYTELNESFDAMNRDGIGLANDIFKLQDALDKSEAENAALRAALEAAMEKLDICPKCFNPQRNMYYGMRYGQVWEESGKRINPGKIDHTDECIIGIALGLSGQNPNGRRTNRELREWNMDDDNPGA